MWDEKRIRLSVSHLDVGNIECGGLVALSRVTAKSENGGLVRRLDVASGESCCQVAEIVYPKRSQVLTLRWFLRYHPDVDL